MLNFVARLFLPSVNPVLNQYLETRGEQMLALRRARLAASPPFLRGGFRPFFFGGAVWAIVALLLWLAALSGWTLPTALAFLAWFVFAPQCLSTIAVTRRETNGWKWPAFMLAYLFGLAYIFAGLTFWTATALGL